MTPYEKMILQAVIDGKNIEQRRPATSPERPEIWEVRPMAIVLECIGKGWAEKHKYFRIAAETIQIGEYTVPKPESVAPNHADNYWCVSLSENYGIFKAKWRDDNFDNVMLTRNMVHLTQKAAEQHAKALIAISGGTV